MEPDGGVLADDWPVLWCILFGLHTTDSAPNQQLVGTPGAFFEGKWEPTPSGKLKRLNSEVSKFRKKKKTDASHPTGGSEGENRAEGRLHYHEDPRLFFWVDWLGDVGWVVLFVFVFLFCLGGAGSGRLSGLYLFF